MGAYVKGHRVDGIGTVLWCNGCNGRKPGMWVFPISELIHQRAGSRLFPPENLVTTVPRFGRSDLGLE